jgi:tRNA(Ile)-lysidine synthetase-like protein
VANELNDPDDQVDDLRSDDSRRLPISRKHPTVARILRRWRVLTGGRSTRDSDRVTVIACSGGADSVALAIVLSLVTPKPILAHIVHDIRCREDALGDRDAVKQLADSLDCVFVEAEVQVKSNAGNLERNARDARYAALATIAEQAGAQYIAAGHHADDQLETMLMHLVRGTGIRGLSAMAMKKRIGQVELLRPMLEITRSEIESLCRDAGLGWQEDETNIDENYLRNRIRHSVLPLLRELEPDIAQRAFSLSQSSQEVKQLLKVTTQRQIVSQAVRYDQQWSWDRSFMRNQLDACLAESFFLYTREVLESKGMDQITKRSIDSARAFMKSDETDPHSFRVGPIVVNIQANSVVYQPATDHAGHRS